jgi:hypothetical protein
MTKIYDLENPGPGVGQAEDHCCTYDFPRLEQIFI